MNSYANTIIVFFVLAVLGVEVWGIHYSLQFKSRLMFLVPWTCALIITLYMLYQIDFLAIAHAAESEMTQWFTSLEIWRHFGA